MATESFFKTFKPTEEGCIMMLRDMMSNEPSKTQQEILAMPKHGVMVGEDITLEEAFALFGSEASNGSK